MICGVLGHLRGLALKLQKGWQRSTYMKTFLSKPNQAKNNQRPASSPNFPSWHGVLGLRLSARENPTGAMRTSPNRGVNIPACDSSLLQTLFLTRTAEAGLTAFRAVLIDGCGMLNIRPAIALCVLWLFNPWLHSAQAAPVSWWSNRTAALNVVPSPETGSLRLGDFNEGYIEGAVTLPHEATWVVRFSVRADEDDNRSASDSVRVTLNGEIVESFPNAPARAAYDVVFRFCGNKLAFRFDFRSANAITSLHQSVSFGEVATEDNTLFAGTIGDFNYAAGQPFFHKPAAPSFALADRVFGMGARDLLRFGELPGE